MITCKLKPQKVRLHDKFILRNNNFLQYFKIFRCFWTTARIQKNERLCFSKKPRTFENHTAENSVAWCISWFQFQASAVTFRRACRVFVSCMYLCVCVSVCASWFPFAFKCTGVFDVPPFPLCSLLYKCLLPFSPPPPFPFPSPRTLVGSLLRFLERACVRRRTMAPRHTLNLRPNAAQHSSGGGGALRRHLNTMYACIYRKTDAPRLYLFPIKGHAARVTWARAYAPDPK